jgi:predicted Zn finger-like uncharacterized protein
MPVGRETEAQVMLIQCPKCKTTYKVSEEILKGAAPALRCSRCKHTFHVEKETIREEATEKLSSPDETARRTDQDQELSFAFPPNEGPETIGKNAKGDEEPLVDIAAAHERRSHPSNEGLDQRSTRDRHSKREAPFTFSEREAPGKGEKTIESSEHRQSQTPQSHATASHVEPPDKILSLDPYRDQQASTAPYFTLFGLLVVFYSLVAVFNYAHPKATEDVVRKIPLVGPSVLKNNHLKNGVILQSLRADYQSIQGNREVFVITGVALNQNPVKVREVRVAGLIYNQEGQGIEQQTVWIGNAISAKIVRGMTAQDVSDLQRLPPLKSFDIPPGDSIPFTIVFLKPGKGVKDFSCEVVAAEGETA